MVENSAERRIKVMHTVNEEIHVSGIWSILDDRSIMPPTLYSRNTNYM